MAMRYDKSQISPVLASLNEVAVDRAVIPMEEGFTIFGYTLENGNSLFYVAKEAQAYAKGRVHRIFLLDEPNRRVLKQTADYQFQLRTLPLDAMLNVRGSVVEQTVKVMERIGTVADPGGDAL